ncbi:MAG: FKBP-type peptidyl-prolyl cis-trans isomerase [Eggerthellaceae bacterium]|jgi:FKBP-type peptidyl-prolyl cis-trans isomerase 2
MGAKEETGRDARYGKHAKIRYQGGIFGEDSSDFRLDEPLEIIMGYGYVCPGLQEALYDMQVGEKRIVIIKPDKGFGDVDPDGIQTYPRVMVPGGADMEVGSVIGRKNEVTGQVIPVRVIKADKDYLTMDYNHPFAGKTLQYEVELVDIED